MLLCKYSFSYDLESIGETNTAGSAVERSIEMEHTRRFALRHEIQAPVLVDVIPGSDAEERLPHSLHLVT